MNTLNLQRGDLQFIRGKKILTSLLSIYAVVTLNRWYFMYKLSMTLRHDPFLQLDLPKCSVMIFRIWLVLNVSIDGNLLMTDCKIRDLMNSHHQHSSSKSASLKFSLHHHLKSPFYQPLVLNSILPWTKIVMENSFKNSDWINHC